MNKDKTTAEINFVEDDDTAEEPTIESLQAQLDGMKKFIIENLGGTSLPAAVEAPKESTIGRLLRELSEGYSPEQLTTAENWVRRQMGGRTEVREGPNGHDEIIFDVHIVTPEDRESGLYNLPDGFTITRSVSVYALARFYLKIILSKRYQTDTDKLIAVIADARSRGPKKGKKRGTLHPEFEFLFDDAGNLKDLRRSRQEGRRK